MSNKVLDFLTEKYGKDTIKQFWEKLKFIDWKSGASEASIRNLFLSRVNACTSEKMHQICKYLSESLITNDTLIELKNASNIVADGEQAYLDAFKNKPRLKLSVDVDRCLLHAIPTEDDYYTFIPYDDSEEDYE